MNLSRDWYFAQVSPLDPRAQKLPLPDDLMGKLIEYAVKLGRSTRPDLEVGICGEHGGEPSSVMFCYRTGMDYVSCSPYRVPIARLAAAQAAISCDGTEASRTK